jgi:hypothetical protein
MEFRVIDESGDYLDFVGAPDMALKTAEDGTLEAAGHIAIIEVQERGNICDKQGAD